MEPVRILRSEGVEPVVFYANSNIHPAEEYAVRLATLSEWAAGAGLEVVEGVYDPEAWETTAGRIGNAADAKFGVITDEEGDLEGDASPARAVREAAAVPATACASRRPPATPASTGTPPWAPRFP